MVLGKVLIHVVQGGIYLLLVKLFYLSGSSLVTVEEVGIACLLADFLVHSDITGSIHAGGDTHDLSNFSVDLAHVWYV